MTQAVDSAGIHTQTSAQALAEAGVACALRYHYNATRAEVDRLHAAGVGFALIGEFDTKTWHPPIHNPEVGPEHGATCVAVATKLGLPAGCVIWLTQDTDFAPGQYDRAAGYWAGAAPVIRAAGFRVGAYGEATFIDLLIDRGLADLAWQAGADAWAGFQNSKHACLRQLPKQDTFGKVQCDLNNVLAADCGVWTPGGAQVPRLDVPTPIPAPLTPHPSEDDPAMIFMRETSAQAVFAVYGSTGRRAHMPTEKAIADHAFIVRSSGGTVAIPPAKVITEKQGGETIWVCDDGALGPFTVDA